eukprot:COSAG02_NODE_150_length_33596_cov_61.953966_27_plen_64_part_00
MGDKKQPLDEWYGMVLFTNIYTCLNGSKSTARFGIESAGYPCGEPALTQYLRSANAGLMLSQQ